MYIIEYVYRASDGASVQVTPIDCENGLVVAAEMTRRNLRNNPKVSNLRVYLDVTDKFVEV